MRMRVKKAIGRYNYNMGYTPYHTSSRADIIPAGSIVSVEPDPHIPGHVRVEWEAGCDSYGNRFVRAYLGCDAHLYLEDIIA